MGGVIGNNATGAHSILYGMTADHLISADVILGDGSLETWNEYGDSKLSRVAEYIRLQYADKIKEKFPRSWRNSAGYRLNYLLPWTPSAPSQWDSSDYGLSSTVYRQNSKVNLASLLAGSEGTLAVMRRAKVNLVPKPKHTILGVLSYASIADACDDVPRLLEYKPSAIELIPRMIIQLARGVPAYSRQMGWMTGNPAAVLVIEFSGDQPSVLKEVVRQLGDVITIAESPEEQSRVWNIRKMGLGILDSRPQPARPAAFIEDCAVPVERLGDFVREVERIMKEYNTEGGIYAHASAGCLHIRPILNLQKGDGVRAMRSIGDQVLRLVLSLGGSMSSEHGDGIVAGEWIEKTYGTEVTEAMRSIKRAADPHNLLNPKKMFDAPPMDSHLRYGEGYRVNVWNSSLHFEHKRGLAGAIEHCNGQGVCRKTTGVMCPSFQATRDEQNSTRGRSNLLRALISGPKTVNDERSMVNGLSSAVFESLDLCLACKGCTSECPSGVDMPKLKYEFMNEYYKTHRRHLRDYLFGYFHVVSKWLTPIAPLANAFMKMDWSRKLIADVMGITDKRPFPLFVRSKQVNTYTLARGQTEKKQVIFLSDVFSRYLEPHVEQAAFDILHAAGYEVKVLPIIGAGASLLSKGFIDAARRHAEKVLAEITAIDGGAGLSVVGCEPPEVYCLKHEYVSLLPERRVEIESITKNVWLVDEFLLRADVITDLRVATSGSSDMKITFHPHCHQRAEGLADDGLPAGSSATVAILRAFGFDVNVIDAGCCGMAGTFGYDEEHYELSMQVGELGVFPAVRMADHIVSSGSACRLQIRQCAGKEAEHPLVLISKYLLKG
jgi:FAD/FMN-containing dehydrogenase/Fe-S oxidoreductase